MPTKKVNKEIKELLKGNGWEKIAEKLRDARDTKVIRIIQTMGADEKVYSEVDMWKREIMIYNAILKVPNKVVELEEEMTEEEILAEEDGEELDIGDANDLFKTQE